MKYDDQLKLLCISLSQCMPIVRKQKMCPCSCCCCATNDYTYSNSMEESVTM